MTQEPVRSALGSQSAPRHLVHRIAPTHSSLGPQSRFDQHVPIMIGGALQVPAPPSVQRGCTHSWPGAQLASTAQHPPRSIAAVQATHVSAAVVDGAHRPIAAQHGVVPGHVTPEHERAVPHAPDDRTRALLCIASHSLP